MTQPSLWMNVDIFTVEQAAALWCGLDPSKLSIVRSSNPSEFHAVKQMLTGAIIVGELPADASTNFFSGIGDHSETLVARSALEAFARSRNQFPAFLFDTLAPFNQRFTGPMPTIKSLLESRIEALRQAPDIQGGDQAPVNRGGRPTEYDWDALTMEIIRHANSPDGLPEKQADLVREMLGWFSETYGTEPAESSVKQRISRIYKYLANHKSKAKNSGA